MTSPVYTVFAQQFLPAELWVPFFNFMQFLTGVSRSPQAGSIESRELGLNMTDGQTYFNTKLKKMRLEAEAKAKKDKEDKTE